MAKPIPKPEPETHTLARLRRHVDRLDAEALDLKREQWVFRDYAMHADRLHEIGQLKDDFWRAISALTLGRMQA